MFKDIFRDTGIPRKWPIRDGFEIIGKLSKILFDHIATLSHAQQTTVMVNEVSELRKSRKRCRLHANWSTPTPYLRALDVLT